MIQITIITTDSFTAVKIAELLAAENLVINVKLIGKVQQYSKSETGVIMEDKFMLTAITKAVLFSMIDKTLKVTYPNEQIEYNAVPIIFMDWEKSEKLASDI